MNSYATSQWHGIALISKAFRGVLTYLCATLGLRVSQIRLNYRYHRFVAQESPDYGSPEFDCHHNRCAAFHEQIVSFTKNGIINNSSDPASAHPRRFLDLLPDEGAVSGQGPCCNSRQCIPDTFLGEQFTNFTKIDIIGNLGSSAPGPSQSAQPWGSAIAALFRIQNLRSLNSDCDALHNNAIAQHIC